MSHPAWGAWIEIGDNGRSQQRACRRTPHGVRGLKLSLVLLLFCQLTSHPAWGAWIEIKILNLIFLLPNCRTPHGVRGLKFMWITLASYPQESHPAWGAWIEIMFRHHNIPYIRSHPAWGAWIEIKALFTAFIAFESRTPHGVRGLKSTIFMGYIYHHRSHPAWGAWIEISASIFNV